MTGKLRNAYDSELAAAAALAMAGDTERAFHHLARAHILSQCYTWQHVRVHWLMLRLGVASGNRREVLGQSSRIVAAAIFSRIWVPSGNTGRANVDALKPMPIPEDLRVILNSDGA